MTRKIQEGLLQLASRVGDHTTLTSLQDFEAGWRAISNATGVLQAAYLSRPNVSRAEGSLAYHAAHQKYHELFQSELQAKGLYDIFLLNSDGDVVYSVYKEQDYATNFLTGKYAQSGLGNVFRATKSKPSVVSSVDIEPYAPSKGAQASFISTGILDRNGTLQGVLAFQIPLNSPANLAPEKKAVFSRLAQRIYKPCLDDSGCVPKDIKTPGSFLWHSLMCH